MKFRSGTTRNSRGPLHATTSIWALALSTVASCPAWAQQAPVQDPEPAVAPAQQGSALEGQREVIVITASSRIEREGFVAPTPLTTIGAADFEERAATHVRDVLYDLPQIVNDAPGSTRSANPGGQNVNLRGLGNLRTLVLSDGRRIVASEINGAVDLNVIPSSLVQRIEVVTGGASAAWGSDAVSGVVNLVLKDSLEGVEGSIQYNVTQLGDNDQMSAELALGHNFLDGRLRVMIAGEVSDLEGILQRDSRDWGEPNYAYILNPTYTATNGQYRLIPSDNATYSRMTAGGVINNTILRGTDFGPGGAPTAFLYGNNVATLFQNGGSGAYMGDDQNLISPMQRNSVFGRALFDLNDRVTLTAEASRAFSHTKYDILYPWDNNTLTIRRDNAFLPASIRSVMTANNIPSFTMGRINYELGPDTTEGTNVTTRFVLAAEGNLNDTWNWSSYYQHGENTYKNDIESRYEDNWALAVDSVINPATGTAVCRSTLTNPTNGCIPANVFGPGSISASAADYVTGVGRFRSSYVQDVVAADLRGELGSTWAGPISLATGLEYREESLDGTSDADSQARRFRLGNAQPISGSESVSEGFFETVIPLAKDLPFAQMSDINAAVRYTQYELAGEATTWKVGLSHKLNDDLRFRITRSRDLRAPRLNELFQPSASGSGSVIDPFTNTQPRAILITTGNLELVPEEADTLTYGVVYEPSFVPGLQLSVDAYDISIIDAIGPLGTQQIIDRCFAGTTSLCSLITRVNGVITEVKRPQLNLSELKARGIDFEAAYTTDLSYWNESLGGRLSLRLLASKWDELSTNDGATKVDTAGEIGRTWRTSGNVSYQNGPLTLATNFRYIGSGTLDNTWNVTALDVENNYQGARTYWGASMQYRLMDTDDGELTLFGRIDNLLDSDPPILYDTGQQPSATNASLYDVEGRNFAVGLRFKFY